MTSVSAGDHVIPLYTPECRQCKSCLSRKTNLCTAIRATQGQGLMPDGTTRLSLNGEPLYQLPPRFHERVTGEDMASLEDRIIGGLVDK